MRLAVLGGAGRTGLLVVDIAVTHGHHVRALSRSPGALPSRQALVGVTGDARDARVLDRLIDGAEAVISTLGPRGRDHDLHTAVAHALIAAMTRATRRSARVPRLVDGIPVPAVDIDIHTPPRRTRLHRLVLANLLVDLAETGRFNGQAPFAADAGT